MSSTSLMLWAAVMGSGLYHGLNPGMGWPLAVAAGLTEQRDSALLRTLLPLAGGHLASIAVVLLPFAMVASLLEWSREIRLGAGLVLITFAIVLIVFPRHPRAMARIRPSQLTLWSFAVGLLHGAGLMLVPMLLGLCASDADANLTTLPQAGANAALAVMVVIVHTAALIFAAGAAALLVYRVLGLKALTRVWFRLDHIWAASLALAGIAGAWSALS